MDKGENRKGKKRSKSYYLKSAKCQNRVDGLVSGLKGFLVTCNNREKQCVREAYALLNKYADQLYGPEILQVDTGTSADGDVEDLVKKEIEDLKQSTKVERRFKAMDSGTKGCIFIKTLLPDPQSLTDVIFTDVLSSGKQQSRSIFRMLPIAATCRSFTEEILKTANELLPKHFKNTSPAGKTFAIIFKARSNATIGREAIIHPLADKIYDLDSANKANLKSPDLAIIVDVIGKYTFLSVVPDYFRYKKYNLAELLGPSKVASPTSVDNESCKNSEKGDDAVTLPKEEHPLSNLTVEKSDDTAKQDSNQ